MATTVQWILLGLLLCPTVECVGQAKTIRSGPTCATCTITWEHVVTIRDERLTAVPRGMARTSAGEFVLVDRHDGIPLVFSDKGEFVRTIGRRGAGPGEFMFAIGPMVAPSGELVFLDGQLNRMSVFTPPGVFRRTIPLYGTGQILNGVVLTDGSVVLNRVFVNPDGAGEAIVEMDKVGKEKFLFGGGGAFTPKEAHRLTRQLGARPNGELWVLHPYTYNLDLYSRDRKLIMSYSRNAEWFVPLANTELPRGPLRSLPPTSIVLSVREDKDGLLWTMTSVPGKDWKPTSEERYKEIVFGKVATPPIQWGYDTYLEVIDPKSMSVLTGRLVDQRITADLLNGYYSDFSVDADGTPRLDVWKAQLNRKTKGGS